MNIDLKNWLLVSLHSTKQFRKSLYIDCVIQFRHESVDPTRLIYAFASINFACAHDWPAYFGEYGRIGWLQSVADCDQLCIDPLDCAQIGL